MSRSKRMGDAIIAPGLCMILWAAIFVWAFSQGVTSDAGVLRIDLNHDGATTISDIWLLTKSAWIAATILPAVLLIIGFVEAAPAVAKFLEFDVLLTALDVRWVNVCLGLVVWLGGTYAVSYAESRIRGHFDGVAGHDFVSVRAKMDEVRRGERDSFP